ncbi:hypothetical protein SH668x_000129 [Planctomicrobium sp. SH668]|uniref:hypothetical protein n=1 Tax=Planctomicrobium sp. SH668 TaxID=3448126 RepID=UPI003F5AEF8F
MPDWLYTIRERFSPEMNVRPPLDWTGYLEFSGFSHISELVTLDSMMCPEVITELLDEDWNHNVHEDFRCSLFRDPEYLLVRQPWDAERHQLLAILESPNGSEAVPAGFVRSGFDIMDSYFGNSTLTNCGQLPGIFEPSIVNQFGLLSDFNTAISVRDTMRQREPEDPHLGTCEVWCIARMLLTDRQSNLQD